ncbi:MAG: exodeoxyribonuclease VII large subunit [Candidatus Nealsonbacteria bacterium CG_4_10_14_0_8_um_filter_37_14]|uniref:Exodeoxyribonuclease 7 large subunit n=1 Tax=Candidatus Nealsonbacteria bacterium CG_4_10_14_0_8_um_filter_37_14 TaxID=1974684 RepID=A0A2M7R6R9_9BACT|nr:MAG: exodeoxyribonuclease VII large subunit [Candidatus Nealsonbacteria bacterium CG11_big_fil_rev_8_21_14_0_20_37_68]PIY89343.1 MAG: exodeoxyribonuclease VII large subunit [Candidatus Nealsonbacteria bacterium CG_4_10_14_0_8_um_filter_37_14]
MEQEEKKLEPIFSVSEYINLINEGLKQFAAKIIGEISEVDFGPTGNIYFYLKDEKDQSILKCMMYKNKYDIYGIELKEGLKIIAEGRPNLHKFYSFAFIAEVIEYSGEGILKKEYEKLKKKLAEEGLFEKERKRPIPAYPQKIGVITSLKGAVIADFSNNLGRFGFKVKIIDSRVEGQAAVADLLLSIRTFKKQDIEALVIMRGGGSLESMMAFNNELLVREVANFPVPVIAAIGHHKDVTLMALAADLAVDTPSIAATTLTESWKQATLFLERYERNIISNYEEALDNTHDLINQAVETIREYSDSIFNRYKEIENRLRMSLRNFQNALLNAKINLRNSVIKSFSGFKTLLFRVTKQLEYAEKSVNSHNPERQLMLGYSIARCNGRIIRTVKNTRIGDSIDVQVTDGKINSEVKNINKINKNKNG